MSHLRFGVCAALLLWGCLGCRTEKSLGILPVVVDGTSLYFVREVRGQNYDALVLSASSNLCQDMFDGSNYVFEELGPVHPYYRWDGNTLHLFHTSPVTAPRAFAVPVVLHELGPREWQELERTARNEQLIRVEVPLTFSERCQGGLH